ncbi:MAG TPA: hypothetical protein VJ608_01460 [Albitalea sp.]|nr:hypothetical protein [Albitalea sp.]
MRSVTDQPIVHQVLSQPQLAWETAGGAAVLGLLLGFALRGSGRKWRKRYAQESEFYATYRTQADDMFRTQKARIAELESELAAAKTAKAAAPVVETAPAPAPAPEHVEAPAAPVAVVEAPAAVPEPAPAPEPAVAMPAWAAPVPDMSQIAATAPTDAAAHEAAAHEAHAPAAAHDEAVATHEATEAAAPVAEAHAADNLTRLRGLDENLSHKLGALGVTRFEEIEKLSAEDEIALEERLGVPAGFIAREQWRSQAALLRAGNEAEFNERYALVDA